MSDLDAVDVCVSCLHPIPLYRVACAGCNRKFHPARMEADEAFMRVLAGLTNEFVAAHHEDLNTLIVFVRECALPDAA